MRVNTEFVVSGPTISDIVDEATKRWQLLIGDESAILPIDAEIHISGDESSALYSAKIFVRSKVED